MWVVELGRLAFLYLDVDDGRLAFPATHIQHCVTVSHGHPGFLMTARGKLQPDFMAHGNSCIQRVNQVIEDFGGCHGFLSFEGRAAS